MRYYQNLPHVVEMLMPVRHPIQQTLAHPERGSAELKRRRRDEIRRERGGDGRNRQCSDDEHVEISLRLKTSRYTLVDMLPLDKDF
jgi:hypothetical protein